MCHLDHDVHDVPDDVQDTTAGENQGCKKTYMHASHTQGRVDWRGVGWVMEGRGGDGGGQGSEARGAKWRGG